MYSSSKQTNKQQGPNKDSRMPFSISFLLLLLSMSSAENWSTCGDLEAQYNHTACQVGATCCVQNWMPSDGHWGCCPYADAVCCSNGYTCCPKGTRCVDSGSGWSVTTACEADGAEVATGLQVCKTADGETEFSHDLKNVVVMGDSVSIGATPFIGAALADVALVHHSPWGGDGGAEETEYNWRCIENLLAAPDGTPLAPDVLLFNSGLHNVNDRIIPGQSGLIADYKPYLELIADRLVEIRETRGTAILFYSTTPELCSADLDAVVVQLNEQAAQVMGTRNITSIDAHGALISECGDSPQPECFGAKKCWCPHCADAGYKFLGDFLAKPIRKLLEVQRQYA